MPLPTQTTSRRSLIKQAGAGLTAAVMAAPLAGAADEAAVPGAQPFRLCLNTATIRGQNLPLSEVLRVVAKAGFRSVEPWVNEVERHVEKGGALAELRKQISDLGLTVENAIAFPEWIVDDEQRRAKGLELLRRQMDTVAQIGGTRIAAPPAGASAAKDAVTDLHAIAERYQVILDLGRQAGVQPVLEMWGGSKTLNRLAAVTYVVVDCGDPAASMLLDVFHLYKGGSDVRGLGRLQGSALPILHLNDYPADPPREQVVDAMRVYPGDGVAPLAEILRTLRQIGFRGALSVELFNRTYWKQSPQKVADGAFAKATEVVRRALV